jgi:hypothetical protein
VEIATPKVSQEKYSVILLYISAFVFGVELTIFAIEAQVALLYTIAVLEFFRSYCILGLGMITVLVKKTSPWSSFSISINPKHNQQKNQLRKTLMAERSA